MRYAVARYNEYQRESVYRIYLSKALRIITENTAKYSGGEYLTADYSDIITPVAKDNRTGDEIAADVIRRAGLEVIG